MSVYTIYIRDFIFSVVKKGSISESKIQFNFALQVAVNDEKFILLFCKKGKKNGR